MKKSLLLIFLLVIPSSGDHHGEAKKEGDELPAGLPFRSNPATLKKAGFKPLFNGKNLTGWKKVGGTASYEVKNGTIRGFGKKSGGTPSFVPRKNMVTSSTPSNLSSSTNLETQAVCSEPFKRVEILMAGSLVTSANTTILRMGHALGLLVFTMRPVVDG